MMPQRHYFLQLFLPSSQICFYFQKLTHNKHNFMTPTVDDLMSIHILKTQKFTHNSTHYVGKNVYAPGQ